MGSERDGEANVLECRTRVLDIAAVLWTTSRALARLTTPPPIVVPLNSGCVCKRVCQVKFGPKKMSERRGEG
jgi:hypothetical protein